MKANELMIGDWIYDRDNKPIKVHASPESYYQGIANLTYPYIEDSKPIPLTDEILEKNGFKEGWTECFKGYNLMKHLTLIN